MHKTNNLNFLSFFEKITELRNVCVRYSDGLASRQHSYSYSLSQQDVHGDADDVENCEQKPHDISGKKKRARAEERTFALIRRTPIF